MGRFDMHLSEKACCSLPFLAIHSREDEPVGHSSAFSASISSHAEHLISALNGAVGE